MNITGILEQIESHALQTGFFDQVNTHEPKNAPGNGMACAVFVARVAPFSSGLASTTGLIVFNVRIYTGMRSEPMDDIDTNVMKAVDALMTAYSGDFELGGSVRCVDLLGQSGTVLSAQAGYLNMDNKIYRVMTLTLPIIVNDLWEQVA